MQTQYLRWSVACLLCLMCAASVGCNPATKTRAANGEPGAFPPTMSDTDYHSNAWTRSDCLVCHKTGVQNAPIVRHVSVPETAMEAKCRTCHVLIPGSAPEGFSALSSGATNRESSAEDTP